MHTYAQYRLTFAAAAAALVLAGCSGQHSSVVGTPPVGGGVPAQPAVAGSITPDTSTIQFSPTALPIRGIGTASNRTFTATDTQQNFNGTFTATSSNTGIATVSPGSVSGQQSAQFTVTPVAVGTCTIQVADGTSKKKLKVTVTTVHGIYVTNRGLESVEMFDLAANGNVAPLATWKGNHTHFDAINLLTVDSNANVVASNIGPGISGSLTSFSPNPAGNVAPAAMLTGPDTGINTPEGVYVDATGNTYVSNADRIVEFAPGANGDAVPIRTITGSNTILSGPYELTLDPAGKIYTAEGNVILVYDSTASGNVAPIQEITGPATGLLSCLGIALDAAGNIYVTNFNGNTINVYAPGATGNVKPTSVITSTALNEPYNIALDSTGKIYVTNFGNNSITVFAAGSQGAVSPLATISGSASGLNQPQGIAIF
jgi:Big-like domain-containing protein